MPNAPRSPRWFGACSQPASGAGESQVLVLRGEPGVGKTALLEYLVEQASGCRLVRAAGVQSEMELAFAGLHQLCAPLLDQAGRLPGPHGSALRTAFGLCPGPPPNRFFVGLGGAGPFGRGGAEATAAVRSGRCAAGDTTARQWLTDRLVIRYQCRRSPWPLVVLGTAMVEIEDATKLVTEPGGVRQSLRRADIASTSNLYSNSSVGCLLSMCGCCHHASGRVWFVASWSLCFEALL